MPDCAAGIAGSRVVGVFPSWDPLRRAAAPVPRAGTGADGRPARGEILRTALWSALVLGTRRLRTRTLLATAGLTCGGMATDAACLRRMRRVYLDHLPGLVRQLALPLSPAARRKAAVKADLLPSRCSPAPPPGPWPRPSGPWSSGPPSPRCAPYPPAGDRSGAWRCPASGTASDAACSTFRKLEARGVHTLVTDDDPAFRKALQGWGPGRTQPCCGGWCNWCGSCLCGAARGCWSAASGPTKARSGAVAARAGPGGT